MTGAYCGDVSIQNPPESCDIGVVCPSGYERNPNLLATGSSVCQKKDSVAATVLSAPLTFVNGDTDDYHSVNGLILP
jgi:hypothetical protein